MLTVMNYSNVLINIYAFNLPPLVNDSILHFRELVVKRFLKIDRTKLWLVSSSRNFVENIHYSIADYGLQRSFRCRIGVIVVW
jgi:hypothetical protein